jgi:flagellar hook-basal body complex protein FliE
MKLELKPFDFNQAVARAGLRPDGTPLATKKALVGEADEAASGSFRTAMADALQNVSRDQMDAQRLQKEFSLDNPTVSLDRRWWRCRRARSASRPRCRCATGCCPPTRTS